MSLFQLMMLQTSDDPPAISFSDAVTALSPFSYWRFNVNLGVTAISDLGTGGNALAATGITQGLAGPYEDTPGACYITPTTGKYNAADAPFRHIGDYTAVWVGEVPSAGLSYVMNVGAAGETEATNIVLRWSVAFNQVTWFHENGAGVNSSGAINHGVTPGTPATIAFCRDTVNKQYLLYVNGVYVGNSTYANNPTGGSSGVFTIGDAHDNDSTADIRYSELAFWKSLLTPAQIATLVPSGGLVTRVSELLFNEANGATSIADVQSKKVWTLIGSAHVSADMTVDGGNVLKLDGDGDYAVCDMMADELAGATSFEISCYVYPTTSEVDAIWAFNTSSNANTVFLTTNSMVFTGSPNLTFTQMTPNELHFVRVIRYTSNLWEVYVDNVLVGSVTNTAVINGTDKFSVGQEFDTSPSDFFTGYIGHFKVVRYA